MQTGQKLALGIGAATIIVISVTISTIYLPSGSNSENPTQGTNSTKIKVIASFFPIYEFTKNVAGDRADVTVFIPFGDEPHGWEPNTQALKRVQDSKLFIYNGAGVEAFIPEFLSENNFPNTTFLVASQGIKMEAADTQDLNPSEAKPIIEQGGKDPHVWNDPILAEEEVRNIAKGLEKADPSNAQYYENNANSYIAKLSKLDQDIKSGLSNCKTRTFISFHNAFDYFSKRYGLTDIWISGLAPEAEISPQDLARVENVAKENHAKIIFAEDLVDPKLSESLAEDVGAEVRVLSPLEGLNETEEKEGVTFLGKWYQNLENLKTAMGCQ